MTMPHGLDDRFNRPNHEAPAPGNPSMNPMVAAAADVRVQAIEDLRETNVLHARSAWEWRRSKPLSPFGISFLYIQADQRQGRRGRWHLTSAAKIWLAGPETAQLPQLLFDFKESIEREAAKAREERRREGFDVRNVATDVHEAMADGAEYVGLGVSSLDTTSGTWDQARSSARAETDIPGSIRIILTDGTNMVVERRSRKDFYALQIHSTMSLEIASGHSSYPWTRITEQDLRADPYHARPLDLMGKLHETVYQLSLTNPPWRRSHRVGS
jgi:hypothetical protein